MGFREKIIRTLKQDWTYPFLLLLIGLVSYVVSFPRLGFYWDDWQAVFLYQNYDVNILRDYFFYDRPFSSWTYELLFPFLPMNPFIWQFFSTLLRVVAIWLFVLAFETIWEDKKTLFRWAGALLLVFPSFTMQSISVAFNQHFITFFLFCLSIYLMVFGVIRQSKWKWVFLLFSNISMIVHIFTMEYFVGLEIIRPIIIYFAVKKTNPQFSLGKNLLVTTKYYSSFFLILLGFVFWRIQIYPNQINDPPISGDPNEPVYLELLLENPLKNAVKLANLIAQDSVYLLTQAWLRSIEPTSIRLDAAFYIFSIFVGLLISSIFLFLNSGKNESSNGGVQGSPYRIFVLIGFLAILFGGLAVWITDRQLLEGKWSDRFSLAPMIGVVLLIMVFLHWLVQNQKRKNILLLFVLGLAIAFQMRTTHSYGLDWVKQQDYYWELYWRIPAVKPGTAFFSSKLPSNTSSRFSIGFFVNTLYSQNASNKKLDYWYFSNGDEGKYFSKLQPGNEISYNFRNLGFDGSTSTAIAFMHKPEIGCTIVLDDAYAGHPDIDPFHQALLPISNPNQIDVSIDPVIPQKNVFGHEPEHDWCYYFEKADLARQYERWDDVLSIMNKAYQLGFEPISPIERMPELEAYFFLKNWESFMSVSNSILTNDERFNNFLCEQFQRLEGESNNLVPEIVIDEFYTQFQCVE